jgi:hypothetical protein
VPPTPTPAPTPAPNPVPLPTQTVVVNLPTDVVNKLSPHESGLPQSWATIIAACIAIAAALLALWGVSRQIRADSRTARQSRLIERMARAIELSDSMRHMLGRHNDVPIEEWGEDRAAFAEMLTEGQVLASMLKLLGAEKSSKSMYAYLKRVADISLDPASPGPSAHAVFTDLLFTLRDELASDDSSKVRQWVSRIRQ